MADFSQTISNTIGLFGGAQPDLWGAFLWGAFLWGEGTNDLETQYVKNLTSEVLTLSDVYEISAQINRILENDLVMDADMESEKLSDGSGYYLVYPNDVTEAEDRSFASYTSGVAASNSWSSATVSSTTWS